MKPRAYPLLIFHIAPSSNEMAHLDSVGYVLIQNPPFRVRPNRFIHKLSAVRSGLRAVEIPDRQESVLFVLGPNGQQVGGW